MVSEFKVYVGPQPFEEKDEDIFFGRELEARNLLSLVIAHNLVLVYSQSGAGKTSLINAKLIPLLKKKQFEVLPVARVKGTVLENIKAKEISNIYVFNAITSLAKGDYDIERFAKMKLVEFLNKVERKRDEDGLLPRVVIFDQLEEIFSLFQDRWRDRRGFFEQVSEALKADPLLSVVFAIREEFIAQLEFYEDLLPNSLRTRFHLEGLYREAALKAIKEPLRKTDYSFAEDVAEKLVDDLLTIQDETISGNTTEVTGEFVEAVQLQVVCQNLLRELPSDEKQITFQHLKTYGSVEKELSKFYDEAIRAAAEKAHIDEKGLRTLFGNVLITEMGTRGMVYRAQESTGSIPNAAIDVLENMHLIRAEWRAGARWYELTHDRFIKPIRSSNKVFEEDQAKKERAEGKRVEKELRAEKERVENKLHTFKIIAAFSIVVLVLAGFATFEWHTAEVKKKETTASSLNLQSYILQEDPKNLEKSVLLAIESLKIFETPMADQLLRQGLLSIPHSVIDLTHTGKVNNVAFSPDGKYIATASDDNVSCVWDTSTKKQIFVLNHTGKVNNVVFSPDGKYIATASNDNTARLWNATTGDQIFFLNHTDKVNKVVFSPDGKYVATASNDNTTRLWDKATGKQIFEPLKHNAQVISVVFSPDGKYIATASNDNTARIWDKATGKQIFDPLKHNGSVNNVVFSPDGKYIATASNDNTAQLWIATTGEKIFDMKHIDGVNNVVFSPDGKYIATTSTKIACLWDAFTGKQIFNMTHDDWLKNVVFSPNGKYIATASDDHTSRIWNIATRKQIFVLNHDGRVNNVVFSPDGKYIATASDDKRVRLWDADIDTFVMTHASMVNNVVFSPDGKHIATASNDNTARLWNATTGDQILILNHTDNVNKVVFSPDGKYIATASNDNTARLWNATTGDQILILNHTDKVNKVVFSPDGKYIATASNDNTARIWDKATGKQIFAPLKHNDSARDVVFGLDGKFIATASNDNKARLWDAATGKQISVLNHDGPVLNVVFSPHDKYIATASADNTARIWDKATGKQIFAPLKHNGSVRDVVFSPDAKYIATASNDKTARLWDATTGKQIFVLSHDDPVFNVVFSPDNKYIATASADKTVRLWDTISGKRIFVLNHDGFVNYVVFSPDGKYVATASADRTARLWTSKLWIFDTKDLINEASNRLTRNLTPEEWSQYICSEPYHKTFPYLP